MQSESRENQLPRVTGQVTTKDNLNHHAAKQQVFLLLVGMKEPKVPAEDRSLPAVMTSAQEP